MHFLALSLSFTSLSFLIFVLLALLPFLTSYPFNLRIHTPVKVLFVNTLECFMGLILKT